jgi:hypothetical protein
MYRYSTGALSTLSTLVLLLVGLLLVVVLVLVLVPFGLYMYSCMVPAGRPTTTAYEYSYSCMVPAGRPSTTTATVRDFY